jgi:hypothetical protein
VSHLVEAVVTITSTDRGKCVPALRGIMERGLGLKTDGEVPCERDT